MKNLFKKIAEFIRVDGLLHILSCYAITISVSIIDIIAALLSVSGVAILKEAYDLSYKKNTPKESLHDILCDVIGVVLAIGVFLLVR